MKGVIETGFYCFIIALASTIFLQFIVMNRQVEKVSEVTNYIQDYLEVHGRSTGSDDTGYILNQESIDIINQKAATAGMTVSYGYDTFTDDYVYYLLEVNYKLSMPVFHISKEHPYRALARTVKPE